MAAKKSAVPRSRWQSLAQEMRALSRELRVAVRMMPRMYWVPMRHVWRQLAARLG